MKAFPNKQQGSYKYLGVVDGKPMYEDTTPTIEESGMDLRDYFAIQIVNAILSCQGYLGAIPLIETLPKDSYKWADAMMEARK